MPKDSEDITLIFHDNYNFINIHVLLFVSFYNIHLLKNAY